MKCTVLSAASLVSLLVASVAAGDFIDDVRRDFAMGLFSRQTAPPIQFFANALGGAAASPVTKSDDTERPFEIDGDTFTDFQTAAQRSCDNQKNACADVANSQQGGSLAHSPFHFEPEILDYPHFKQSIELQKMGNVASTLAPLPPSAALQTPYNPHCAIWYPVKPGDNCEAIAKASCGDVAKLQGLNPALAAGECNQKLWVGYNYCVRAVGDTSPCGIFVGAPTPTQDPCPSGYVCHKPGESGCPTDRYCKIKLTTGPDVTQTSVVVVTADSIDFTTA
ncbi:hypothetical protein SCUP515_09875 [Seiridium cupressi]